MFRFLQAASAAKSIHHHQHPDEWLETHHVVRALLWALLAVGFIASLGLLAMTLVQFIEHILLSIADWLRNLSILPETTLMAILALPPRLALWCRSSGK